MGQFLALFVLLCLAVTLSYSQEQVEDKDCYTGTGSKYEGTVAKTKDGKTCRHWKDLNDKRGQFKDRSKFKENYCRGIMGLSPICYHTGGKMAGFCDVPKCAVPEKCYDGSELIYEYNGKMSVTKSGLTCQRWDTHTPHNHVGSHGSKPEHFPEKDVKAAENYCRIAGLNALKPWCYTTDPKVPFDVCEFPLCKGYENCYFHEVSTYKGTVSKTKAGEECLRWDSEDVMMQCETCGESTYFPDASVSDASNYCRQPFASNATHGHVPWCFTANGWGYCDIPPCPGQCSKILSNYMIYSTEKGNKLKTAQTETQEECIKFCQRTPGCYRWSYFTTTFMAKNLHKVCTLMKSARVSKRVPGINSGSRFVC